MLFTPQLKADRIYTSAFKIYEGPGRISIARWSPRKTPAGYRVFKTLAPKKEMMNMAYRPYKDMYFNIILKPLVPEEIWQTLHFMANGAPPVLLCWEKPPFTEQKFCHRTMVAQWLQEAGFAASEVGPEHYIT